MGLQVGEDDSAHQGLSPPSTISTPQADSRAAGNDDFEALKLRVKSHALVVSSLRPDARTYVHALDLGAGQHLLPFCLLPPRVI